MKGHEKKKEVGLKVILGVLIGLAVILVLAIVIVKNVMKKNKILEEEMQLASVESEASALYEDSGAKHAAKYYDEFIEKEETVEGKVKYIKSRIKHFDFWCGWGCSEQILADVHQVAELANGDTSITSDLCIYQEEYFDDSPIEGCDYSIEEVDSVE